MADRIKLDYQTPPSAEPFHGLNSPPSDFRRAVGCLAFVGLTLGAIVFGLVLISEWPYMPDGVIAIFAALTLGCGGLAVLEAVRFSRLG